jgi:hypothetical protein
VRASNLHILGGFGEVPGVPKSDRQPTMTEQLDLTDEEKRALIALLKRTLEYARYPLAPRLDPLKAILAKLDPPARPVLEFVRARRADPAAGSVRLSAYDRLLPVRPPEQRLVLPRTIIQPW